MGKMDRIGKASEAPGALRNTEGLEVLIFADLPSLRAL
jgi:hypothetical protein